NSSVTPTVFGLVTGTYQFELVVTDNAGYTGSSTVTITVNSNGSSSTASVMAVAGKDTTVYYPVGDTAMLNGSGSYASGSTIASYSWTQVGGSQMSITNSNSPVAMVAGMAPGSYVFLLTVTNSMGDTSTAKMTVHVQSNERSTEHIGLYPNPVMAGQQLTISGTNGYAGQVKFLVIGMSGTVVKEVVMDKQAPDFQQTIDVSGLSRGTYVLWVQFYLDKRPYALKFVVD
ncbi:MAG TPA: T9SS type A sorting domain-containing protein, partial [Puia sp.]|nr:T9SS type A sorting domain-containing protein [Puia sp.]